MFYYMEKVGLILIKRVQCEKGRTGSCVLETRVGWGKSIQIEYEHPTRNLVTLCIEYEHPTRKAGYFMLIKTLINKVEPIQYCNCVILLVMPKALFIK